MVKNESRSRTNETKWATKVRGEKETIRKGGRFPVAEVFAWLDLGTWANKKNGMLGIAKASCIKL